MMFQQNFVANNAGEKMICWGGNSFWTASSTVFVNQTKISLIFSPYALR